MASSAIAMDGRPISTNASMIRARLDHDVKHGPMRQDSVISLSTQPARKASVKRSSHCTGRTELYYSPAYGRLLIYVSYLSGGDWVDRHSGQSRYRERQSDDRAEAMDLSRHVFAVA